MAKAYGLVLDEWQENVLEAAMGVRSDGQWSTPTVGVSVPRQNGKGAIIEARELAGLLLFGEKTIIHSAHEQKTARIGFERILAYFENYDDLRKKVRGRPMSAIGRENIKLKSGAELHFPARSKGAIRGFSIDCLILDEGQILGDSAWDAIKPTISARPNVQTWVLGTPPTPLDDGAVFSRMRHRGLEGKDLRLCWCEWSAPRHASFDDREAWADANPALGIRITEEAISDELNELSTAGFGRERLGIWDEIDLHLSVIPSAPWSKLVSTAPPAQDSPPTALAVDMSDDRTVSIAGAWSDGDSTHVELLAVDTVSDTLAAVEWLADRAGSRIPVVVRGTSSAAAMIPALKARRVKLVVANETDAGKACGGLFDAFTEKRVHHAGQDHLDKALQTARKRPIGKSGAWGWDGANVSPVWSVTLAHYGASIKQPSAVYAF